MSFVEELIQVLEEKLNRRELAVDRVAIHDGDEMVKLVTEGGSGYFFGNAAEKVVVTRGKRPGLVSLDRAKESSTRQRSSFTA
jgi:hypothetical protein